MQNEENTKAPNPGKEKTIRFVVGDDGTYFTVTCTRAAAKYIQRLTERSIRLEALERDPTFSESEGSGLDEYVQMINDLIPGSQLARFLAQTAKANAILARDVARCEQANEKQASLIRELSFRAQAWDTVVALLAKIR